LLQPAAMTLFSCGCDVCTHAPTTVRRLRCRRELRTRAQPDLHTPSHIEYAPKLLPAEAPVVVYEDAEVAKQPQLRRLGVELPWLALLAIALVVYANWPESQPVRQCTQPCSGSCAAC
jgi:hypothetical protein